MRKLIWCSVLSLGAYLTCFAQSSENPNRHEVRWDAVSLVASGNLNLSYEYLTDTPWSFGITAQMLVNSKKEDDFLTENTKHLAKWHVGPYVRYRLSENRKSYYFAEANALYNSGDYRYIKQHTESIIRYESTTDSYTDVAVGGAIGYKILFNEHWGAEISAGTGWNLINTDESPDLVTRVGVRLAYRF